jgi:hypothetical protein
VIYEGGDLLGKLATARREITVADFKLRPGSPGYRAAQNGKDLGADLDLVGPGKAYERWKQSPQYQEWRQETGQSGISRP